MRAQAHGGKRTHNPLPPMESHACTKRGQTTDRQQSTTNHIALPSRQVSSLISNDVCNIDAPANGAIRLNINSYALFMPILTRIIWYKKFLSIPEFASGTTTP